MKKQRYTITHKMTVGERVADLSPAEPPRAAWSIRRAARRMARRMTEVQGGYYEVQKVGDIGYDIWRPGEVVNFRRIK
jgi:hypothetical protein